MYCYFAHALHALRRVPVDRTRLRDEAAMRRAGYRPSAEVWREHEPCGSCSATPRQPPLRGWLTEAAQAGECAPDEHEPP